MKSRCPCLVFCASVMACAQQPGDVLWRTKVNDYVLSSPALAPDGTIYVVGEGSPDRLAALRTNGVEKWSVPIVDGSRTALAVGTDGTIYFGSDANRLMAFRENGELKWEFETGDSVWSSPAVGPDGGIYFGCHDRKLRSLSPDGSLRWVFPVGGAVLSSPALGADGTAYFGANDRKLYAVSPNGVKRWELLTAGEVNASPAIAADGTIYIGAGNVLYAVNPNGSLRWTNNTGFRLTSPALGANGTIYLGMSSRIGAFTNTGSLLWSFNTGAPITSSPALAADNSVYLGSDNGTFFAVHDGIKTWDYTQGVQFQNSSPVLGPDGVVYVGTGDGYLVALRGDKPPAASSWPMFRRSADRKAALPPGSAPVVVVQPENLNAAPGSNVVFKATAVGAPPLRYQWIRNGRELSDQCNVSGSQTDTLVLAEALVADTGDYNLVISNDQGTISSITVRLNVLNGFIPPGTRLWDRTIGGNTSSSPAVGADGSVYLATDSGSNGVLHAFGTNGAPKWTFDLGTQGWCPPTVAADGTVFIGLMSPSNQLVALNSDGGLKWRFLGDGLVPRPAALALDGTAYFTANSGNLYAVRSDGTEKWKFPTEAGGAVSAPIVAADGTIYVGAGKPIPAGGTAGVFHALKADGTEKWHFDAPRGPFSATPAIAPDGTIIVPSSFNDGMLYALASDGKKRWELKTGAGLGNPVVAPDGTIYVVNGSQMLWSVRLDGTTNWAINTKSPRISTPALSADGTVHFVDFYSRLRAWAPSGRELWEVEVGGDGASSPAIDASGRLLVGAWDKLVAIMAAGPSPATGWPMLGREPTHQANAATALPTPPPQPANVGIVNGRLQFKVVDPLGNCLVVEVSSDLLNWTSVSTNRPNDTFAELDHDVSTRFYRVRGNVLP